MATVPNQYSFECPDCGTSSQASEHFFVLYAGQTVTRWCGSCQKLFDISVPQVPTSPGATD